MTEQAIYRIVLADDDRDIRALTRRALEDTGRFEVIGEAVNGEDAVAKAMELRPDVLLLDLAMPRMDGLTALPLVRESATNTLVVVVSGLDAERMAPLVRAKGASAFMPKGLGPRDMVAQLLAYLAQDFRNAGGGDEQREAFINLTAEPLSARRARRFVEETLAAWKCHAMSDIVLLLTSELVTNAILHAGSDVDLSLQLDAGVLRIAIADRSPAEPVVRDPGEDSTHGRGMVLLEAMSDAWSVVNTDAGKIVWFDVPTAGAADADRTGAAG
jgi:DNA-binding NarL/FixJ family response regulator